MSALSSEILHVDFETRSAADLLLVGADKYSKHHTTDALCMSYAFGDGPVKLWKLGEALPYEISEHIYLGLPVYAYNAPFELAIWNNCCVPKYGWIPLSIEQTFCTMAMTYAMSFPGKLEKAAPAAGIKEAKLMTGHRVMLQYSQPREIRPCQNCRGNGASDNSEGFYCAVCKGSHEEIVWWDDPAKFAEIYEYCIQDVVVERELHKRLMELSPYEREVWLLDQKINNRGVQVDLPLVKFALEIVQLEEARLHEEMREATGNQVATCNSHVQLIKWLAANSVVTESVDKEHIVNLLLRDDLPAHCRKVLLIRQESAKSSTKKLLAMVNGSDEWGRMRGLFQYHGANTGRWSGRRVQLQNLPRPSLEQEEIEEIFETITKRAA